MSDSDYDPDWWKKERDASLERRQVEVTATSGVNPGDSFLIVTEGTVTEPIYFELFLAACDLSRVFVVIISGRASDPRHVIQTGRDVADEQTRKAEKGQLSIRAPAKFDHVWAVIDTDVAVGNSFWNEVEQLADARGVTLAHSTPCFEFWLLLHLVEHATTRGDLTDGAAAKAAVKKELGQDYSTNEKIAREAIGKFVRNWPRAVLLAERVRLQHQTAGTPAPANPSTEVDRLERVLNFEFVNSSVLYNCHYASRLGWQKRSSKPAAGRALIPRMSPTRNGRFVRPI